MDEFNFYTCHAILDLLEIDIKINFYLSDIFIALAINIQEINSIVNFTVLAW